MKDAEKQIDKGRERGFSMATISISSLDFPEGLSSLRATDTLNATACSLPASLLSALSEDANEKSAERSQPPPNVTSILLGLRYAVDTQVLHAEILKCAHISPPG